MHILKGNTNKSPNFNAFFYIASKKNYTTHLSLFSNEEMPLFIVFQNPNLWARLIYIE
jgi:hypothetical protein